MSQNELYEIKKAHWIEWYPPKHMILTGEEMLYTCSACTAKYEDVSGFRYCPFCGALIDKKEEEG